MRYVIALCLLLGVCAPLTTLANEINDALDCHNLVFETGGDVSWFVQTSNTANTAKQL